MRPSLVRPLAAVACIAVAVGLVSCGTEPRVPTTVSISPSPITMTALGETQVLTLSVLDQHGKALGGKPVWSSTDTTIVRIDSTGVVRAIAVGNARVLAVVGSVQGSAAVTVAQVPATLSVVSGDGQISATGVALASPIVVKVVDSRSNPIPSVGVTFAVTSGGGSVSPTSAASGANGQTQTVWTLGALGGQTLTATATGSGVSVSLPAAVNATATAGTMSVFAGSLTGLVGFAVNARPAVRILAGTTPVSGLTVTFAVASGGGNVTAATAVTNSSGVAQVGSWTLGAVAGVNTATATSSGVTGSPVTFTATGATAAFNVVIQNVGPAFSAAVQTAFDSAAAKWQRIIYQDIADIPNFSAAAGQCGTNSPAVGPTTVDDVLILARFDSIDGPGNVLGSAGPCFIRTANALTVMGQMRFDTADVAALVVQGQLNNLILHEMGHVLGFGSLWNQSPNACRQNTSSVGSPLDTYFSCLKAVAMFDSIGGTSYTGGFKVPVENCGPASPAGCGTGTINSHWREPTFVEELMTGYLNGGVANPLSRLTSASMEDIGYGVNYAASDSYMHTFTLLAGPASVSRLFLGDDVYRGPIYVVDRSGRVVRVMQPR